MIACSFPELSALLLVDEATNIGSQSSSWPQAADCTLADPRAAVEHVLQLLSTLSTDLLPKALLTGLSDVLLLELMQPDSQTCPGATKKLPASMIWWQSSLLSP